MDIRFVYGDMTKAASAIEGYSTRYSAAATKFVNDMTSATSNWTGDSKEKFMKLINGDVNDYIGKTVPEVVKALAEMLKTNADEMSKTDAAIAESIPAKLG